MTTITFDTLELVDQLKSAGVSQSHAEAIVRVIAHAHEALATKECIELALAPIKTDLAVLKWMMGVLIAIGIALILKAFL